MKGGGGGTGSLSSPERFYITWGFDESHFNLSLVVRGKVTKRCLQITTFGEKGQPNQKLRFSSVGNSERPKLRFFL